MSVNREEISVTAKENSHVSAESVAKWFRHKKYGDKHQTQNALCTKI